MGVNPLSPTSLSAPTNLDEIYRDDAILDHRRNPRNPRRLDDADIAIDGVNPFCGDEIHLQINYGAATRASPKSAFRAKDARSTKRPAQCCPKPSRV